MKAQIYQLITSTMLIVVSCALWHTAHVRDQYMRVSNCLNAVGEYNIEHNENLRQEQLNICWTQNQ